MFDALLLRTEGAPRGVDEDSGVGVGKEAEDDDDEGEGGSGVRKLTSKASGMEAVGGGRRIIPFEPQPLVFPLMNLGYNKCILKKKNWFFILKSILPACLHEA